MITVLQHPPPLVNPVRSLHDQRKYLSLRIPYHQPSREQALLWQTNHQDSTFSRYWNQVDIEDKRLKSGELTGSNTGRIMSNDEREKRRISALNRNKSNLNNKGQLKFYWKITTPNNDTRIVHGLREYCEANKICSKAMERLAYGKRKIL